MKARNVRYLRPGSVAAALRALQDAGPDAVPMAGGQSLLAALNMRLSSPTHIVDIGDLAELRGIDEADGVVRIGAATRHAEILRNPVIGNSIPLLCEVGAHIAHIAIRNRGTIGGSLAYADPAAEWPAAMVALEARIIVANTRGERSIAAEDFFVGLLETALQPGELILRIEVPIPSPDMVTGFGELARRHGDFALVGLVVCTRIDQERLVAPRLVYLGCSDHARKAVHVMDALDKAHVPLADAMLYADALRQDMSPSDIPGLRGDTRMKMAEVLTRRVLNSLTRPT